MSIATILGLLKGFLTLATIVAGYFANRQQISAGKAEVVAKVNADAIETIQDGKHVEDEVRRPDSPLSKRVRDIYTRRD